MLRPDSLLTILPLAVGSSAARAVLHATAQENPGSILRVDRALDGLVPPAAAIEKVQGGFRFTEGPVWIQKGDPHLLFSDGPGNTIYRWSPTAGLSVFRKPIFAGEYEDGRFMGPNGLTLDPQGRLVFCEHGNRRVSRLEPDGRLTVVVDRYQGRRLNSPNDLVYKSDGSLYFTDPPYGLAGLEKDPARELDFNGIFRLDRDGTLRLLNRDQTRPNGIAFSADERRLYVANSDAQRKVWMVYDVTSDGHLENARVFYDATSGHPSAAAAPGTPPVHPSAAAAPGTPPVEAPGSPDGLKVDERGNVWATGPGGVWIFNPDGRHLGTIQPPEVPANLAFGDADGKTLYMTARTALYRIRVNVAGAKP